MHHTWWSRVSYFLLLGISVVAYNFDVNNSVIYEAPRGAPGSRNSYFGFSVALFPGRLNESWILVGAPRANSSRISSAREPGAVYKCRIGKTCKEWPLNTGEDTLFINNWTLAQLWNGSWIGATVAIQNSTSPRVVVCGPRWKNIVSIGTYEFLSMNGACYSTKFSDAGSPTDKPLLPLADFNKRVTSTGKNHVFNYGMGQFGFSLHMVRNETHPNLILGSPGVFNLQGIPVLCNDTSSFDTGCIIPEHLPSDYINYVGYAVTSGSYFNSEKLIYATSAPRADPDFGAVLVFSFPLETEKTIRIFKRLKGKQRGEYFGSALASCDINNDGREDLVVGSPFWTANMGSDEGRIYIFLGNSNNDFDSPQIINGTKASGRFGSTVTCLGDVDYDGYADIAVGAPYENKSGAVYVYNGCKRGLREEYSQYISGSQFNQGIRGFGISISEPRNIDQNGYADIAVGAYLSGHVVLLRSRPVITLEVFLTNVMGTEVLQLNSTSFEVEVCSRYSGAYAPSTLNSTYHFKVDRRAEIVGQTDNSVQMTVDEKVCTKRSIRLKDSTDKNIESVVIEVSQSLPSDPDSGVSLVPRDPIVITNDSSLILSPVINKELSITNAKLTMNFALNCGNDNICHSELYVSFATNAPYVIGSIEPLKLNITVVNYGEPAYVTKLSVYIPSVLSLIALPEICNSYDNRQLIDKSIKVVCNIANRPDVNRLDSNAVKSVEIVLRAKELISEAEVRAEISTQSNVTSTTELKVEKKIDFAADVDIALAGEARDSLYSYYHEKDEKKQQKNITFQHIYEVQKMGVSPIMEAVLTISVPTHWVYGSQETEFARVVPSTVDMLRKNGCKISTAGKLNNDKLKDDEVKKSSSIALPASLMLENHSSQKYAKKKALSVPPENRTLFLNCSSSMVKCTEISCMVGPFESAKSVAKLNLTLDLLLSNLKPYPIEGKDILFYVTNADAKVDIFPGIPQKSQVKTDSFAVGTQFVGSPPESRVAAWIIIAAILLGILLFILIIVGLIKAGFFHRTKKVQLQRLKAEDVRRSAEISE